MAVIGVKLADETFYPILKQGVPAKKTLRLTTVSDGQAVAHIELFCSEDGTMNAARYVDTLLLERVAPQRSGEPDIAFAVSVDERNVFRAEARDSESGSASSVQALLSPFAALPDAAPRAALPASPPKTPAKRAVSEKPKKNEMPFVVGGICVLCVIALLLLLFCFVRSQNAQTLFAASAPGTSPSGVAVPSEYMCAFVAEAYSASRRPVRRRGERNRRGEVSFFFQENLRL
jgi:hypothetical protein